MNCEYWIWITLIGWLTTVLAWAWGQLSQITLLLSTTQYLLRSYLLEIFNLSFFIHRLCFDSSKHLPIFTFHTFFFLVLIEILQKSSDKHWIGYDTAFYLYRPCHVITLIPSLFFSHRHHSHHKLNWLTKKMLNNLP